MTATTRMLTAVVLTLTALTAVTVAAGAASAAQSAQDGEAVFRAQCGACHSTGADRLVGPGLAGVTERRDRGWLLDFITRPDQMIAEGDSIATSLVQEYGIPMPNLGLSEAQAASVLDYLAGVSAPAATAPSPQLSRGDASLGRALFVGERRFENRGAACIACHTAGGLPALGGGTLARDLTSVATRYGPGLAGVLRSPPFPAMQAVYGAHPLTGDEVAHLGAFLLEVARQERAAGSKAAFPAAGFAGAILLLAFAGLAWRGRLRGVRKPLIGGSR